MYLQKKQTHMCLPIVGIVVTISPNFNLYRIVVLPAASRPTIKILISFLPKRPLNNVANIFPMVGIYICQDLNTSINMDAYTCIYICVHTYIVTQLKNV